MNRTSPARTTSRQSAGVFAGMFTFLGLIIAIATVSPARATPVFGTASDYNEFILGDSTRSNVDVQGKVAVGGNANFTNFTVASLQPTTTINLVVGNLLTAQSATVRGSIVTGGNATYTNPTVHGDFSSNGSLTLGGGGSVDGNVRYLTTFNQNGTGVGGTITGGVSTPLPTNFAAESAFLTSLSAAQYNPADPSPSFMFSQMFINAAAGDNYYKVRALKLPVPRVASISPRPLARRSSST